MAEERRNDDLELAVLRHNWRLDALDTWRSVVVEPFMVETKQTLESLTTADKIAEAVAEKMSSTRDIRFTKAQLTVAYLAVAAAVASPFIAWLHP